jgi:simple sugar transport system ATP-binding protein
MKDDPASQLGQAAPPSTEIDMATGPLVELGGLTKRFPGVVANDQISLVIRGGEIQTILGENGAGKTTLINILSGMLQPDEGQILLRGQEVKLASPQEALKRGIGTVYQHFTLVPNLSVIENIILGAGNGVLLDLRRAEQQLRQMLGDFGWVVSPQLEVQHLSLGQQQRVEIIKALFRGSQVLLLDEPTSVLTPLEVNELFEMLRRLKAKGVAVVFITHKLDEALALSDRVTVLRQGRCVGQLGPEELSQQDRVAITERIVGMMFGRSVPLPPPSGTGATPSPQGSERSASHLPSKSPVCVLDEVTALGDRGTIAVRGVHLRLHPGEIFGIAGVDGNGQKELAEVIAGQRAVVKGEVIFEGVNITNQGTSAPERAGIGYITDDRLGEGCVPSLSLADNLVLKVANRPPFSRWTVLNRPVIEQYAQSLIQRLGIKTSGPWARVETLSGGNIQKLLLARELAATPKVLICNQPTQGLDMLTAQFVLRTLREQADQDTAVLLISSELDEIMAVSDRIGVMYNGQLVEVSPQYRADRETIGRLMLGSSA